MVVTADLLVFREICEHRSGGYRPCTQNPVGGARLTEARHLLLTIIFLSFCQERSRGTQKWHNRSKCIGSNGRNRILGFLVWVILCVFLLRDTFRIWHWYCEMHTGLLPTSWHTVPKSFNIFSVGPSVCMLKGWIVPWQTTGSFRTRADHLTDLRRELWNAESQVNQPGAWAGRLLGQGAELLKTRPQPTRADVSFR